MSADLPPVILGNAGLTGRQQIDREPDLVRPDPYGEDPDGELRPPSQPSKTIPPNCLRVLNSPLAVDRGGGCGYDCPGRQRDGGCLVDVVRAANAAGVEWAFSVTQEGGTVWWDYAGDRYA